MLNASNRILANNFDERVIPDFADARVDVLKTLHDLVHIPATRNASVADNVGD